MQQRRGRYFQIRTNWSDVPRTRGGIPAECDTHTHARHGKLISSRFFTRAASTQQPGMTRAHRGHCSPDGAQVAGRITDTVCHEQALSIKHFHKGRLVHDDIQDGDEFRLHGRPTVHIEQNVGDYLIGLGSSRHRTTCSIDTTTDILNEPADARARLSEGHCDSFGAMATTSGSRRRH